MSLPTSYFCRSAILSSLENLFTPSPTVPFPSEIYLYGNHNTGKLTIVKQALQNQRAHHFLLDCREIYSLNMFYQSFISSLPLKQSFPIPNMKSFHDFVRALRDFSIDESNGKKKKSKTHFFVVIHHLEILLNYDNSGHLLYLLFKLNELTFGNFPHTLVLIGHQPFYQLPQINQIEAELGVLTPISIFVPAYTKQEIVSILQQIITQQEGILPVNGLAQVQIIIELALQVFYAVTNDLIELKDMLMMCIKDFLRCQSKKQIENDSTNNDYRMLYQKEFFTQVLNSVYTRSMSIPKFLDTHTADEEAIDKKNYSINTHLTRDLSQSAKYLLIAIYLATQNPVKYDRMLYDKQTQGKKTRRAKVMHKKSQLESAKIEYLPLSSNKPIGLNRVLAIYYGLQGDSMPFTTQIYVQLGLLASMRLIEFVGTANETSFLNLNEPKFRCTSSSDFIRRLAASVDFKIDDLLLV